MKSFLFSFCLFCLTVSGNCQLYLPMFGSNQVFNWHNKAIHFSYTPKELTMVAGASTDMFRDPGVTYNTDTAPKLLTQVKGDFVLSARVTHSFVSKWDGGAFVLMQDSFHWVKFCFEKDYLGKRRIVSVVTRDVSDDCNSETIDKDMVYMKIARKGKVVTLYFSNDNENWTLVRHLQLDWSENLQLGFLAQSPTGEKCEVRFSDIYFDRISISDPYLGK